MSAVRIALGSVGEAGVFEIIHSFHPCKGRRFRLVTVRHNWGEDRVYYHDEQGRLISIPASWTNLVVPDPFVTLSAGRSAFRVDDLLELLRFVEGRRKGAGDVR